MLKNISSLTRHLVLGFILTSLVFINGCATQHRKDGPPNFYVDETKVPDAVPRNEQPAKYGNMKSYRVFGKTYYVMPKSVAYEERGIASWYGSKFHNQRTSSGERYNMLGMTAAHKTLPLPTYVQVTNLKNGRKIVVKVNDRGPFESNRLIDLSYVAAKKLGMLGHGTTYVDVKSITPGEARESNTIFAKNTPRVTHKISHTVATTVVASNATGAYFQVGSFRNKSGALHLKNHLTSYTSLPVKIDLVNHLYKVKVGPINTVAENSVAKQLKSLGINASKIKLNARTLT